ncbi:MAG: hypothetical protein LLF97_11875 [Planctomycetaceae bacterium]|nr:hypothetical protein [Planctomycetaceae bacterium]
MNLVGKIFTVLILITSVLFMSFAMAVYATHRNWRTEVLNDQPSPDKPLGLARQLKNEQEKNKELTDQAEKLKVQMDAEKKAKEQAVASLESTLVAAKAELDSLQKAHNDLEKSQREAVAAMNATQANATGYRKEVEQQRTKVAEAQQDRDAHFKEVVKKTDELNQAFNDKELLRKRTEELGKDLAKALQLLRKYGLDPNRDYSDVPPKVDGLITATPGGGLVEISIGSDDGLLKGHRLEVYRSSGGQSTYVGRIEVVKTAPEKSVCRIDPKFQNSNMLKGDRVASKID